MKITNVPRMARSDTYHINSNLFEHPDALEKSVYYLTFRSPPTNLDPYLVSFGDERILFAGIEPFVQQYLAKPITTEEIDRSYDFFRNRIAMSNGTFSDLKFPVEQWYKIARKFNGHLPLLIEAVPEGTVVYPGEPVVRVTNTEPGYGWLAAHIESSLMAYCWSCTETLTIMRHWLERNKEMVRRVEGDKMPNAAVTLAASLMFHDFSRRSAICDEESAILGYYRLMCFPGTDTLDGAYLAHANDAPSYIGSSVPALAHRIVQGFVNEEDCYRRIYDTMPDYSIISMVADCYDYCYAVKNYLLPLAKESVTKQNGKVVVARPDSGDPLRQILYTIELAIANGLYTEKNGFKYGTTLRFIEGDGMSYETMSVINDALIMRGYAPHGWGLYGVGGTLHNGISRDDLSCKYALCAVGKNERPVIKFSNTPGKQTYPKCKVVRDNGPNLVLPNEPGQDILVPYYDNGVVKTESFNTVQNRVINQFDVSAKSSNGKSKSLQNVVEQLRKQYVKCV